MVNSKITSDEILTLVSDQWLTKAEITKELGIKQPLDKNLLSLKLMALKHKEEVIDINYNDQIYWKCHKSEGESELKISFGLQMLDEDPFNAEIWYRLGNLYLERSGYVMEDLDVDFIIVDVIKQAKECYKNALRFVDTDINFDLYCNIVLNLALIHFLQGKTEKAQSQFLSLLEIKEELEEEFLGRLYLKLAQIYLIRDKYDQALDYAIKSSEIIPNDSSVKMVISRIRIKKIQENLQQINMEDQEINPPEPQTLDDTDSQYILHELLKEMRRLIQYSEKELIISMKSYINQSIVPFLDNPSNKRLKKLKNLVNRYKEGWPDDMWESFVDEYHRRLELYKELQPSKWAKWGKILMQLVSIGSIPKL